MGLGRSENAHLPGARLRRLAVRIGQKKAALAIAHTMLVIVSHLLTLGTSYREARYDQ